MRSSDEFGTLKGIGQLAEKLVKMKKDVLYPLVYTLVTLSLILPVAIATVERVFLAMNIINHRLRNRMGDKWMNDCLITYIEKDIFKTISNE
jgi:signal transduction histidine kinase